MNARKIFLKIDVVCFVLIVYVPLALPLSLSLPRQVQKRHRSQLTLVNLNNTPVSLNSLNNLFRSSSRYMVVG